MQISRTRLSCSLSMHRYREKLRTVDHVQVRRDPDGTEGHRCPEGHAPSVALVPGNQHSLRSASQLPSQRGEHVSGRVRPSGLGLTGSVVELSLNRLTPSLIGARTAARSLGSTDIAPLQRYYGPLRLPAAAAREVVDSLPALSPHDQRAPRRISQVPASICRHAPSPITPDGSTDALARCFSADGRLYHLREVGRRRLE